MRTVQLSAAIAIVALIAGCGPTERPEPTTVPASAPVADDFEGTWVLATIDGETAEHFEWVSNDGGKWDAKSCNWMGLEVSLDLANSRADGSVAATVEITGSTLMACIYTQPTLESSTDVIDSVRVDGETLTFTGAGVALAYRKISLDVAALVERPWALERSSESAAIDGWTVNFEKDGTLTGTTTCRTFRGTWNSRLAFLTIEGIELFGDQTCETEDREQRRAILAAMSGQSVATVTAESVSATLSFGETFELRGIRSFETVDEKALVGKWEVTSVEVEDIEAHGGNFWVDNAWIEFASDGTVRGSGGCLDFTARWHLSASTVEYSEVELASGGCAANIDLVRESIGAVLVNGFRAVIDGDILTATSERFDGTLVMERVG